VQTLPPPRVDTLRTPAPPSARRGRRRLLIFGSVLLIGVLIGLAIVYGREPIYRASASVLTVKPKAIDTRSADADVEHVAIQRRLLLGEDLLGRLSAELSEVGITLNAAELLNRLAALPVPETNLLELRADGNDPAELQTVVNRWAQAYETFRAEEIEALSGRTIAELEGEQQRLDVEIIDARAELQRFRETNDIVSLERGENRSLASLRGLNDSVNKAREKLVEAQAEQAAILAAAERGETVMPNELKSDAAKLRVDLQRARQRLGELRERYTEVYIEADPTLRELPGAIRSMERELAEMQRIGRETALDESQQAVASAQAALAALERQLDEQQASVQDFTERFKEFKRLEENLARLDTLYADIGERLARIRLRNLNEYPPIQVVEWARLPETPIAPDYERDLMIALGIAVGVALFVTWLVDYLSASARDPDEPPTQLDVHIHAAGGAPALDVSSNASLAEPAAEPERLQSPSPRVTDQTGRSPLLPREFAVPEIQSLLRHCPAEIAAHGVLLLNGVSPYELPLLHQECFDAQDRVVEVPGASRRMIGFSETHWAALAPLLQRLNEAGFTVPVAELDQALREAARHTGLGATEDVSALALWHSYVLHLVRQGIAPADLTQRVGAIVPEVEAALRHQAPPGLPRSPDAVQFEYPLQAG
jgi:uncharacterized protein involved in exopolysaccharide biosynthesis